MTRNWRIVIDTGVAISAALLPRSVPRLAFDAAVRHGRIMVSEATIDVLENVFRRPKFDKYTSEENRLEFLAALVRESELIEITESVAACRDPNDDKFLELAASGNASHLISGDPDLLVLHPFGNVAIVTPRDFLTKIESDAERPS